MNIALSSPEQVRPLDTEVGVGFMFAPSHHTAMKHAAPVRRGARGAHHLQHPRPADQSGRRDAIRSWACSIPIWWAFRRACCSVWAADT